MKILNFSTCMPWAATTDPQVLADIVKVVLGLGGPLLVPGPAHPLAP